MKLTPTEPDIKTLVERINSGDIDLQPDFQRQEVWSVKKKKKLIDTVLREWSIPPVHLVELNDGRLEVLDGQQRLAALRDFLNNKFSIDGAVTPYDPNIETLNRKFYKQLEPTVRRRIDQYGLRCFRISDYSPEEPSELFYRLNQPTMLTAGEQRNALYGPAREQLKELVQFFEGLGNNRETIGFSNTRLAYDDILARLIYFIETAAFSSKSTETRISERFRSHEPFPILTVERARRSVRFFSEAREAASPLRFNKASVLSWLVFYSRFLDQQPAPEFLSVFIRASSGGLTAHYAKEATDVFEDRASLRVTDVSSVVYRDFVLCYLYTFFVDEFGPPKVDATVIRSVEAILKKRDDASFECALSQALNVDAWSSNL